MPLPLEVLVPEARQQTPAVRQRATRPDGRLHGLGQTKYIDDMYLPGMLFAKIKRAGVASARIISIDTNEAEAMPGVVAVHHRPRHPLQLLRAVAQGSAGAGR